MTYEEAIEEMENIYQNGFDNDFDNDEIEKPLDAIRIAIKAIEKHIPKKPVMQLHENRVPGEQEEYYCPTCGEWITWDWKWKCCAFCGQKIDWSEEA